MPAGPARASRGAGPDATAVDVGAGHRRATSTRRSGAGAGLHRRRQPRTGQGPHPPARNAALPRAGGGRTLPVGTEIDARAGRITLVSAVTGGLQDGTFWGARFSVRQSRGGNGMTSLVLKGVSVRGCPS